MTDDIVLKPHLSISAMRTYLKCGEQWRRRYVEGDKIPPGAKMLAGTGAHASAAADLVSKATTGALLTDEHCADIARDSVKNEWERGDVALDDDEMKIGLKAVYGQTTDLAVLFADAHHRLMAPKIEPIADRIEWKWRVETDQAHDLLGVIDRVETVKVVEEGKRVTRRRIRDLKTTSSKTKPSPDAAAGDDQLVTYSIASEVIDGEATPLVAMDTLRLEKGRDGSPVVVPYVSTAVLVRADYDMFWKKFERVSQGIAREVFVPAKQGMDWWCSEKWCGYAKTCPFFRGKVTAAVPSEFNNAD